MTTPNPPDRAHVPTPHDARELLRTAGAPSRLLRHAELVSEVAAELCTLLASNGVALREDFVVAGAALHDIGKAKHQQELHEPGHLHEAYGESWLLAQGAHPTLARVCVSHAQWSSMECTTEELVIALADKLWKGKRVPDLELLVIDRAAASLGVDRFDVFAVLDEGFEAIAMGGDDRLARSVR